MGLGVLEILLSAYLGLAAFLRLGFLICAMAMGSLSDGDAWMWCLRGCTERSPAWRGASHARRGQKITQPGRPPGSALPPPPLPSGPRQESGPAPAGGAASPPQELQGNWAATTLLQLQAFISWDFFFSARKTLSESALRGFGFLPPGLYAEAATQLVGFTSALQSFQTSAQRPPPPGSLTGLSTDSGPWHPGGAWFPGWAAHFPR